MTELSGGQLRRAGLARSLVKEPDLYTSDPITFHDITKSLSEKQKELEKLEDRWLEIEEMKMQET